MENEFLHDISTDHGSSGSPVILDDTLEVIGIHKQGIPLNLYNKKIGVNKGSFIGHILDKIKYKLNYEYKNINNKYNMNQCKNNVDIQPNNIQYKLNTKYKNIINLIYFKKECYSYFGQEEIDSNNIFGFDFVYNNEKNIELMINVKKCELSYNYNLEEGINNIQIKIKNKITNLENMFKRCISLINIEELKYLNTKKVNNFSHMFDGCKSLFNIKSLEDWDVSNGKNFSYMFYGCSLLQDIKPLQNWNVSNGNYFSCMFGGCSSLIDIKPIQNWNVSNGKDFTYMFNGCSCLSNIKPLENWNISENIFDSMFKGKVFYGNNLNKKYV